MKLYYMPGACSMASHIVLNELGIPVQFTKVLRDSKRTEDGEDYLKVNPNGYVPALRLDDGEVLTENAAILPYIGERKPESGWMPERGMDRHRTLEWLGYINSELHANYKPLFMGQEAIRDFVDVSRGGAGLRTLYLRGHREAPSARGLDQGDGPACPRCVVEPRCQPSATRSVSARPRRHRLLLG
jgi:glutathione S-transferase